MYIYREHRQHTPHIYIQDTYTYIYIYIYRFIYNVYIHIYRDIYTCIYLYIQSMFKMFCFFYVLATGYPKP